MKAYLNDVEFEASSAGPIYRNQDLSITICLHAESIPSVVEAAGEETDIVVENIFSGNGYKLESIAQYYETVNDVTVNSYEIRFSPVSLTNTVQSVQDDLETMAGAIEELAEIIGGAE